MGQPSGATDSAGTPEAEGSSVFRAEGSDPLFPSLVGLSLRVNKLSTLAVEATVVDPLEHAVTANDAQGVLAGISISLEGERPFARGPSLLSCRQDSDVVIAGDLQKRGTRT